MQPVQLFSECDNSYAFARRREYAFREAKLKNQQFKEKVSKYKHCLGFVRSMGCLFTLSFCLQTLRRCHAMIRSKRWELLRGLFLEERVKRLVVVPDIQRLSRDKQGEKKKKNPRKRQQSEIEIWQGQGCIFLEFVVFISEKKYCRENVNLIEIIIITH